MISDDFRVFPNERDSDMTELSVCLYCMLQATVLLLIANGAPILATNALDNRWIWPVDNQLTLGDGNRLFGDTKTWRGCCTAMLLTTMTAFLIGIEPLTGLIFGALAMTGDLSASFIKRRRNCAESTHSPGLDTIPESLLPILALKVSLTLSLVDISLIVIFFFLIEEFISPILYRLHIRKRPY
jgi:CDP-diglyceride synthetase